MIIYTYFNNLTVIVFCLERIDASKPIDMASLCTSGVFFIKPEKNHFGFNLTSEGLDRFEAKVSFIQLTCFVLLEVTDFVFFSY